MCLRDAEEDAAHDADVHHPGSNLVRRFSIAMNPRVKTIREVQSLEISLKLDNLRVYKKILVKVYTVQDQSWTTAVSPLMSKLKREPTFFTKACCWPEKPARQFFSGHSRPVFRYSYQNVACIFWYGCTVDQALQHNESPS